MHAADALAAAALCGSCVLLPRQSASQKADCVSIDPDCTLFRAMEYIGDQRRGSCLARRASADSIDERFQSQAAGRDRSRRRFERRCVRLRTHPRGHHRGPAQGQRAADRHRSRPPARHLDESGARGAADPARRRLRHHLAEPRRARAADRPGLRPRHLRDRRAHRAGADALVCRHGDARGHCWNSSASRV